MAIDKVRDKEEPIGGASKIKAFTEDIKHRIFGMFEKKEDFYTKFDKPEVINLCSHMLSSIYKDHDVVFLAHSGYHLVFKIIDKKTGEPLPEVVKIKMTRVFQEIFDQMMKTGKIQTIQEENYRKELEKFDELSEFFDEKNLLKPKMEKQSFTITSKDIIDTIAKKAGMKRTFPGNEITIEIPYTTQPLAKEMIEGKYVDFGFWYSPGAFKKTLGIDFPDNHKGKNRDLPITGKQLIEHLDTLFDLYIREIKDLKDDEETIVRFFESMIRFDEKYKEILDIYGSGNFTFFLDKNGNLDFHLIDPTHRKMFMKKNTYTPITEHMLQSMQSRKIGFEEYSGFAYPYIVTKMKKYVAEHKKLT